jgi:hypothetical protein
MESNVEVVIASIFQDAEEAILSGKQIAPTFFFFKDGKIMPIVTTEYDVNNKDIVSDMMRAYCKKEDIDSIIIASRSLMVRIPIDDDQESSVNLLAEDEVAPFDMDGCVGVDVLSVLYMTADGGELLYAYGKITKGEDGKEFVSDRGYINDGKAGMMIVKPWR